ncbi:hypothetical protein RJ639_014923 [Escallonia herrerae]|uniref:Reverse transcriptase RNase H-like domain-containing protein n=1 Tax=Escallonia herrerae TaxID=1293975 RepID=A0AA88VJV0_9ASTE|nr:hypothetical protein RJ639_014923 [Escallonia herrerae]
MDTPLYGFSNHPITVEGVIALPVTIPSAYNAILGRPAINQLQVVVSTYHLKIKFPMEYGIGEVKGDQTVARHCYVTSCRSKNKDACIIEDLWEDTKKQRGELVEDLVSIEVYPGEKEKTIRIETRYPKIDNMVLALITTVRRLCPYFQSHTIVVLTDQPLKKVLLSPKASGRLVNWSVEWGILTSTISTRIKAQALANFIIECTLTEDSPHLMISKAQDPWNLYADGCSAVGSSGVGIILINPEGFVIEYALQFGFQASNEVGYEAILTGIRLA